MIKVEPLFPTLLYRAPLGGAGMRALLADLARAIRQLSIDDAAGRRWCKANRYPGYTSYASLDDLAWRDPAFAELERRLDLHVRGFAKALAFDLTRRMSRDSLWVNLLNPGGVHGGHIHPGSAISGTIYVEVPKAASAIRFEDPRLPMMMAAPAIRSTAPRERQRFIAVAPKASDVLLWESWLRHDVPVNGAKKDRLSISFNYR